MQRHIALLVVALATWSAPATPATVDAAGRAGMPSVEIGLDAVAFGGLIDVADLVSDAQGGARGFGPSLSITLRSRIALEAAADRFRIEKYDGEPTAEFHRIGLIVRFPRPDGWRSFWFVRAGSGGQGEVRRVAERREDRFDGGLIVYPGYTHRRFRPVTFGYGGFGLQRAASRHVAVRAGFDVVVGQPGVGFRLTTGVSIPLGSYPAR